jgi:hypothetical protein
MNLMRWSPGGVAVEGWRDMVGEEIIGQKNKHPRIQGKVDSSVF